MPAIGVSENDYFLFMLLKKARGEQFKNNQEVDDRAQFLTTQTQNFFEEGIYYKQ